MVRPQPGGPLYVPDMLSNREGPQARAPSKCQNRWTYGERLARGRLFARLEAQRGSKKDSNRAITPAAVHFPANLALSASLQAKQLHHLHTQISLGQSCHRQEMSFVYAHRVALVMSGSLCPFRLWPARLLCQREGFSRQEYWSLLTNTGCHTLLEHYISCCPSTNSPEYLVLPELL